MSPPLHPAEDQNVPEKPATTAEQTIRRAAVPAHLLIVAAPAMHATSS